ncbi:MAG: hypothetical protein MR412_00415, partial [Firmicutes bacterium]|nr:hypothetical protein [Bacillota bacterium]
KKKTKKGLKKRIGLIAIGGLSLVLTICLSVGATLAWFAGSTWSSNQLYMGGPVYVEMAGRGAASGTSGDGSATAKWVGGAGNLDIKAATARKSGTSTTAPGATGTDVSRVLLPGEKFQIYSQARVFSTLTTSTTGTDQTASSSSGANVTNTSSNGTAHITNKGRITSTTTSVLRARFSISVEFDPSVGFNNFTGTDYMSNYPVQSGLYRGAIAGEDGKPTVNTDGKKWQDARGAAEYKEKSKTVTGEGTGAVGEIIYNANSRRDAVTDTKYTNALSGDDLAAVKAGTKKSIYSWKFVSKSVYDSATGEAAAADTGLGTGKYAKMAAPFDGSVKTGNNGFYGVWILDGAGNIKESDSFYKDRCNAYIDTYVEEYCNEYGEIKTRTIGSSLSALEDSLNASFVQLVNDSSDNIIAGHVNGMTVNANGDIEYAPGETVHETNASWLYIDPKIGNDTNTNELSTGTGGWWYLVSCDEASVKTGANNVNIVVDSVTKPNESLKQVNTPGAPTGENAVTKFTRKTAGYSATDEKRLTAQLYEINPLVDLAEKIGKNGTTDVTKVVSYAFPFVNGSAALPGDALTNVFANAKITFQISFQALQAFFPYSTNIDSMDYTNALLGTAKALNIGNAIPIFNEAFDYQESFSVSTIEGL